MKTSSETKTMNLYILNDVLSDYTCGMAVIAAESKEHARELFIEQFDDAEDFDRFAKFIIIENVNHPAGIVSYVYGGG
jgi:rRNA maturation protein Rpf1